MGGLWPWMLGLLSLPVKGRSPTPTHVLTSSPTWGRLGPCMSGPGLILGAPPASSCPGACGSSFSEGLTPEGTQTSWDKDIPAINQELIPEETPESSFLLEGDILRPSPFRLLSATSNKWPKNGGVVEVPFLLSRKYDEPSRKVILQAFAEFERFTCIRFVAYHGQRDFISIIPVSGCFSGVGRSGGMQVVSLAPTCLQKGPGIVLHELMHVLGFWHEHSRADRDRYIRVNWNEILPGFEINFIKSRSSNMLVPYDYASVLHYGRLAFSRSGLPTIMPLWGPSVHIGQRWNLSASDITRVLRLYDCSPSGPGPQGREFQAHGIDGSPTAASGPQLQRLLEALLAESRNSSPSDPRAGESPLEWEPPVLGKSGVEASARWPQTSASSTSSRSGAAAPGGALEWPRQAHVSTMPLAPSREDQPAPVRAVWGKPALGNFLGTPRGQPVASVPKWGGHPLSRADGPRNPWPL
ncbi:hypothetical protein QTO34_006357 [Cnephaeus nilssonii]|uniref:Metalloendopeptidase n=1 Tax=Cnephaeus nilssonii TaxID=3371016 RepID=A0AA40HLG0_CNENI|nr:hypothetical protein QTO34_006357 [Eptesicus nilssonii]